MDTSKFIQIINFAIAREIEAAKFYNTMAHMSKNDPSKELFGELETMEYGHARILENLGKDDAVHFVPPQVTNLQISDFMEEPAPSSNMTFQQAMVIAMKREENAKKLYTALAEESHDPATKNVFRKLASEESKHKFQLESMYDDVVLLDN